MAESRSAVHFGTDGWRGVIADDFTFANLRAVSAATAAYVKACPASGDGAVLVGYDRRFMSREFAQCAASEFAHQGLRVLLSETPLPTPAMSFSVKHRGASWGIVITASHNPASYNGFKLKEAHGRSAPPEVTDAIERLLSALPMRPAHTTEFVRMPAFDDRKAYSAYLKSRLDWSSLRSFKGSVVFDHLYGVAAGIPESLLSASRWTVHSLHAESDPLFGGLHPEPIECQLSDLMREVRRRRATVGIALDGDADRLGVVDDRGRYLTPHQVFPLLVLHAVEHKGWRGKVVQAVSLGYLSERIAQAFGLPFEEVPVGFKHVAERMLHNDFLAGGEESGGYAVRGGLPERDGILNGLLFLEMLAVRRQKPSELLKTLERRFGRACFERFDIVLERPMRERDRFAQAVSTRVPDRLGGEAVREVRTRDGVKIILQSGSWVLMRPSGTEPLIRTYAETGSPKATQTLLQWAREAARL